jgi:hypothetical protein
LRGWLVGYRREVRGGCWLPVHAALKIIMLDSASSLKVNDSGERKMEVEGCAIFG